MTKTTKNILIIVVIAILVFALICIIYQHYSQKPLPKTVIGEGEILPDANSKKSKKTFAIFIYL